MKHLRAINKKARRIDEQVASAKEDIFVCRLIRVIQPPIFRRAALYFFARMGSGCCRRYGGALHAG